MSSTRAMLFILFAVSSIRFASAQDPERRLRVRLQVTVTQDRDFVTNLTQQSFTVLEKGRVQKILDVNRRNTPASLCLVIDSSGSTIATILQIRETASVLLRTLGPD